MTNWVTILKRMKEAVQGQGDVVNADEDYIVTLPLKWYLSLSVERIYDH